MLRIYDTLEGKKKEFVPVRDGSVGMYFCGMTVQSEPHVGHMRVALVADVFKRYLEYKGYRTILVINFTDIDDKIIAKAQEEGVDYLAIAERNIEEFMEFLTFLGVEEADVYPRATDHIPEIIGLTRSLIDGGYAYESDGYVYFDVGKWSGYGRLSGKNLDDLIAGASQRIDVDERKKHPEDFCLWKGAKEGEPSWDSPWGKGRPGWHIECSAMSMKYLGEHFDIHGGGTELIFPHHENEIAQSEAATGKPYVNHWVHHGLVNLVGEKMSKSTGHFKTMAEIADRFPSDVVRFYLLSTHYRSEIEFSEERLREAAAAVERFRNLFRSLGRYAGPEGDRGGAGGPRAKDGPGGAWGPNAAGGSVGRQDPAKGVLPSPAVKEVQASFEAAMDDDLNTAQAIGHLFELVRVLNQEMDAGEDPRVLRGGRVVLRELADLLGLFGCMSGEGEAIPDEIMAFVRQRSLARASEDWELADTLRSEIEKAGYLVEDAADGPVVRRGKR